jgi:alkylation response protein AidB-like acyl-CoA dehydrogenase
MFQLDESSRMVEKMVRGWCEAKLAPRLPALEAGTEMPWALMRELATTFGVAALAEAAAKKRVAKLRAGEGGDREGGGSFGGDPMMMAVFVKELSRVSPGFAMGWGVSVGLAGGAIVGKGTARADRALGAAAGDHQQIGSWCLTEPGAGSDAFGSMTTTAVPTGGGYRLRGSKTFITNGPGADVFVVYARVDRGEPRAAQGISTFILDRGMPGLTTGPPFKKMGMRDSPTCEVFLDDVEVGARAAAGRRRARAGRARPTPRTASAPSARASRRWPGASSSAATTSRSRTCASASSSAGRSALPGGAAEDRRPVPEAEDRRELRVPAGLDAEGRVSDPAYVNASKALCSQLAVDGALTAIQLHGGYGYMEELRPREAGPRLQAARARRRHHRHQPAVGGADADRAGGDRAG